MPKRPHMPLSVKLEATLIALGFYDPSQVQWDHDPALHLRPLNEDGTDWIPSANDPRHIVPMLSADHKRKTFGDPAVPLSGDISKIRKTDRLEAKAEAFRDKLLAKSMLSDARSASKGKRAWPKRKLETKAKPKRRTTNVKKVVRRRRD